MARYAQDLTFCFTPTVKWVTINARSMQPNQDNRATTARPVCDYSSAGLQCVREADHAEDHFYISPDKSVMLTAPLDPIDSPETEETLS